MRPDYRANLIHLHWCKSRYPLQRCMLGLTAEQKLLINTTPQGRREADSSGPDPIQSPLKSVRAPSAPVGLGSGPRQALSQLRCQNAKSFSIGFASLVLIHVWRSLRTGRGGRFLRFFLKTEEWFHPCQHVDFVQKNRRKGRRFFSEAIGSLLQHSSRGWTCPPQGPLGP